MKWLWPCTRCVGHICPGVDPGQKCLLYSGERSRPLEALVFDFFFEPLNGIRRNLTGDKSSTAVVLFRDIIHRNVMLDVYKNTKINKRYGSLVNQKKICDKYKIPSKQYFLSSFCDEIFLINTRSALKIKLHNWWTNNILPKGSQKYL